MTLRVLLILFVAALAAGCDESLSTFAGPSPNLQPTFSSIQQNVFEATDSSGRAACTGCHNAGRAAFTAGLNLSRETAYAALVGARSTQKPELMRVAPGDPDSSYLIHKLEGHSDIVGQRMPRTSGPFLTEGQITILRRWITIGAPND
jgi:hypothetical protein